MGCLQVCGGLLLLIGIALIVISQIVVGLISGLINTALLDQKTNQYICVSDKLEDNDKYNGWEGDLSWDPEGVPSYYDMYLFSIHNPKDYLVNGAKAVVVENGPFVFQQFSHKKNIAFDGEYVSYSSQTTYVLLDADREIKGKYLGAVTERTLKKRMNVDLTVDTQIANFNLGYIGLLNVVGNEAVMFFTVGGCTPTQILDISKVSPDMTTETCGGTTPAAGCACCAMEDTLRGMNFGGYYGGATVCRGIDKGIRNAGAAQFKDGMIGSIFADEAAYNAAIALKVTQLATPLTATFEAWDAEIEANIWYMANSVVLYGSAATLGDVTAYGLPVQSALGSTGHLAYGPSLAGWRGILPQLVAAGAASKGTEQCTTAVASKDPRFHPAVCLSGGKLGNHDLVGKFCNPANGWVDASEFLKVSARMTAYAAIATPTSAQTTTYEDELDKITGKTLKPCSDYTEPSAAGVGLISLLASYDGGIAVLNNGDPNGFGTAFSYTSLGQAQITTPLVTKHSANDALHGYPVALLGAVMPMLQLGPIWAGIQSAGAQAAFGLVDFLDFKIKTLNGFFSVGGGGANPNFAYPVPDQASYTARVGQVCADKCVVPSIPSPAQYKCSGKAPDRYDDFYIGKEDLLEFASNECRPYSWTFSTKYFCGAIEAGISNGGVGVLIPAVQTAIWSGAISQAKLFLIGSTINLTPTDSDAAVWLAADGKVTTGTYAVGGTAIPRTDAAYPGTLAAVTAAVHASFVAGGVSIIKAAVKEQYELTGNVFTDAVWDGMLTQAKGAMNFYSVNSAATDDQAAVWIAADGKVTTGDYGGAAHARGSAGYGPTLAAVTAAVHASFVAGGVAVIQTTVKETAWNKFVTDAKAMYTTFSNNQAAVFVAADLQVTTGTYAVGATAVPRTNAAYAATLAAVTQGILNSFDAGAKLAGTVPCTCADVEINARAADFMGCCLADGMAAGTPLTGFGCLTQGSGYLDTQFEDGDLVASMQRKEEFWVDEDAEFLNKQQTCPIDGKDMGQWAQYYGETEYAITASYSAQVDGGDGKTFKPMGLTMTHGEKGITKKDAHPADKFSLYVSQALRPLDLYWQKNENLNHDVTVARYGPKLSLLNAADAPEDVGGPGDADAADKGQGVFENGLASISHFAPGKLALYLSQPNFMSGDTEALISQHDYYNCWEYGKYADAETVLDVNGLVDITKCTKMTKAWIDENRGSLNVAIDVEPGTGMAIGGHSRLQASARTLTTCSPAEDVKCNLGVNTAKGECHKAAGTLFWNGLSPESKAAIGGYIQFEALNTAYVGINPATGWTPAKAGFPCSQANVITPKLKGGNVMPMYWADIWGEATDDILLKLSAVGDANVMGKMISTPLIAAGIALAVIGLVMIALCKAKSSVTP